MPAGSSTGCRSLLMLVATAWSCVVAAASARADATPGEGAVNEAARCWLCRSCSRISCSNEIARAGMDDSAAVVLTPPPDTRTTVEAGTALLLPLLPWTDCSCWPPAEADRWGAPAAARRWLAARP